MVVSHECDVQKEFNERVNELIAMGTVEDQAVRQAAMDPNLDRYVVVAPLFAFGEISQRRWQSIRNGQRMGYFYVPPIPGISGQSGQAPEEYAVNLTMLNGFVGVKEQDRRLFLRWNGSDLLLFQRVQRNGGFWRFSFVLQYVCYKQEKRKDKAGVSRTAIVFGLVPLPDRSPLMAEWADVSLAELRHAAAGEGLDDSLPIEVRLREMCRRSEAVQLYALGRARGVCEACGGSAPFTTMSGSKCFAAP